jgi:hypothetical protein
MLGKNTYSHMKNKFWHQEISKYCQKIQLLRYRKIILLSYLGYYVKLFFPFYSVPLRASEWAVPCTSECPRNEHFLPQNNGIHSESTVFRGIFSEKNSVANPTRNGFGYPAE